MQQSKKLPPTPPPDTFTGLLSADEAAKKNYPLIKRRQIPGTPFNLVHETEMNRFFLVMGDYRITEPVETEGEALDKLLTEQWQIMVTVMSIVAEKMHDTIQRQQMLQTLEHDTSL